MGTESPNPGPSQHKTTHPSAAPRTVAVVEGVGNLREHSHNTINQDGERVADTGHGHVGPLGQGQRRGCLQQPPDRGCGATG
jgi:hypothetical protein